MSDNRTIIQKADTLLSSLTSGGLLLPKQADKFIEVATLNSVLLEQMQRENMKSPKEERDKILFEGRVLRPGSETVALPLASRVRPTTSKVELDAKLFKAEIRISTEALEDNIEGEGFENRLRDLIAKAVARDLEDLAINGDTASTDSLLASIDGFRKQATTNVVLGGGATLSPAILKDVVRTMPVQYIRDRKPLRFLTAYTSALDYQSALASRGTLVGDKALTEQTDIAYAGIPVVPVPLFPTNLGNGQNETELLFCDPGNMIFGVWRNIRFETDKDISGGSLIVVVTMRVDFRYAHEPAVVKATGIVAA